MMKKYFDDLKAGIEEKLETDPGSKSPRKLYALELARLGSRLYSGEGVAWCGITVPFDLLSTMGVTSCFVEFVGAMLATTGLAGEFITEAEQGGYGGDACGYHRTVMGAAMKGMLPEPDFLVGTTCPCSGGLAVIESLARHFEKDLFVLNVPQEKNEKGIRYLADQIRDLAGFVADHTGNPLDTDHLRDAVIKTNQACELMDETFKLAMHVPSPVDGRLLSNFGIGMLLHLGKDAGVEIAREYRDMLANRVDEGVSGIPNEQLRLLWIQNRIQFKNPIVEFLEKEYGAVVVTDELNYITWEPADPEDPYPGMAERAISNPFNGQIKYRIEHLQHLAKSYKVDGAINPCNWGCRQGAGARGLISGGLKEIGVPVLNLEVDCIDPRNFAEGQMRTRIEAFVEMLENR